MASKRKSLSKTLRFEVFKRDQFACQYCGQTPPSIILEIDHIVPVSKGGDDEILNLITSCADCNRGKAARDLNKIPESLDKSIQAQKESLLQVTEYNDFLMAKRKLSEGLITEIGRYWFNQFRNKKDEYVFGSARIPSIKTFLRHLAPAEIMDAMDIAIGRYPISQNYGDGKFYDDRTWRYFCGICWKKIKQKGGNGGEETD